jgi:hypothetical protein
MAVRLIITLVALEGEEADDHVPALVAHVVGELLPPNALFVVHAPFATYVVDSVRADSVPQAVDEGVLAAVVEQVMDLSSGSVRLTPSGCD